MSNSDPLAPSQIPLHGGAQYSAGKTLNFNGKVLSLRQRLVHNLVADNYGLAIVCFLVLLYTTAMLRLVFHLYDAMGFQSGWDLAIFDQATWLISRGYSPFVTVRGLHILSDHFSIILYVLAPLYWLWDSPKVLLTAQTLALASSAFPLYYLARERLDSARWGLLFTAAFLSYPLMQWANTYEFHPDTLAVPLLLMALLCLWRKQWRWYFCCLIGAALTKENVGLTIFFLGFWVWCRVDKRIGWFTVLCGLACTVVALSTVRYFNAGVPSGYYLLYERYGHDLPSLALGVATNPERILADVTTDHAKSYLAHLLQPLMFLPLLTPSMLIAMFPALGTNLLSSRGIMQTLEGGYYSALLMPLMFASAIESCRYLRLRLGPRALRIVGANLLVWIGMSVHHSALWKQNQAIAETSPVELHTVQQRRESVQKMFNLIPPQASVAAQIGLTVYLSHRQQLYTFPNPFLQRGWGNTIRARRELEFFGGYQTRPPELLKGIQQAAVEYVALCPATSSFPLPLHNFTECALLVTTRSPYGIVYIDKHCILLRRRADRANGRRLLSKISGVPIRHGDDSETAFRRWLAIAHPLSN